ncbi:hypothetical protein DN748_08675 [Sinomicrobium soli]|nr:hypothetical protein DN748_08675 [Sinomicrobium sp. N-1-3-6]
MKEQVDIKYKRKCFWVGCLRNAILCFLFTPIVSAQSEIDSLYDKLAAEHEDSARVVVMIELSRELHRMSRNDDEDLRVAIEAMETAETQSPVLYARAVDNLGLLYRFYQQYREAITLHARAYELIADLEGHAVDKMRYANNAGVACRYNSDYDMAVTYHMKALHLAEKENNTRNIEIACNGIGNTLIAIPGKEEEGLAYLEKALGMAKQVGNQRGIAIQNLTIGGYYDQLGQHDKARAYFGEILKINETRKDAKGRAMGLKALGESYLAEGTDLEKSARYFNDALTVFKEIGDRQQQAYTLLELGDLNSRKMNYARSLALFDQVNEIAEDLNDKALLQSTSEKTSRIYEALHNYPLALAHYKKARDYQDSINLTNQMVQISAISRRYDLDKKESEIALLKKEQSIQEMQLERHSSRLKSRGIIIVLLIALFVALLIVLFLQKKNRNARKKTEELLIEAESERLKAVYEKNLAEAEILASQMRINPHFLFNCLNSIKNLIQHNRNKQAIKYLVMLARFSRLVLETASKPVHSLSEELDLIKYYIELEKNRFDDSFSYTIDNPLEEQGEQICLPSLLLQPFVENAIWHGLLPGNKEVKILSIAVEGTEYETKIRIDDTGVGRFFASRTGKQHKSRGTEINDKRISLFNKNHPNTIYYEYIDKKDDLGNALGTTVIIHIKTTCQS